MDVQQGEIRLTADKLKRMESAVPGVYATSVQILSTEDEVFMDFGQIMPESIKDGEGKLMHLSRIIMSRKHAKRLAEALSGILAKTETKQ